MKPRVPPHDMAAEVSVLGSILIDSEAIIHVAEILMSDDFYEPSHRMIYDAMVLLFEKRKPIDAVTLASELKKAKTLSEAGGASAIAKLTNEVSTSSNVTHYANIVAECSMRRSIISTSSELGELAFDESKEAKDILDITEQKIFAISQKQDRDAFVPIKDTLSHSFERLDEMQRNPNATRGIPTGLADLDNILAGFGKSNLIILAARPGMGKTALSLNIAQHIAVNEKLKVGFFSLEMSKEELVDRLLVSQADIDAWRLKTGRLDQQDFMKLSDAMGVLADAEIYIDDKPGMSIFEMRTKARRLTMEHGLDFLVVDYLQLAHGRTRDNRVQEVAEISGGLKNIARELRIPVLALSQLSRAIESRGEKTPQLSDLRESGSIEQDADAVMFLYRRDDDIRESVNLKIAKHRHGSTGDIDLYFRGDRLKFYGLESRR
jgi:replicative DNA helicase